DIELPDIYADEDYKEKSNASALKPDQSKVGIFEALPALPIATLKTKSAQRVVANPYYNTATTFIKWMHDYKNSLTIPLQWSSYAADYTKRMNMFKLPDEELETADPAIRVSNNGFDLQRVNQSTQHSKEVNETYLKQVRKDLTVAEAFHIMMDWVGN
ncbi:MAG TPA: carboxy terminal-processing peptidase, partial [Ferruginibacter sp.]|nr:carboxy terminal-processing peptidase [Ferruginibacter sp.]